MKRAIHYAIIAIVVVTIIYMFDNAMNKIALNDCKNANDHCVAY